MSPKEPGPSGFLHRILVQGATPRPVPGSEAAPEEGFDTDGIDPPGHRAPAGGPDGAIDSPLDSSGGSATDAPSTLGRQMSPTVPGSVAGLSEPSMGEARPVTVDRIIPAPAARPMSRATVQSALPGNTADAAPRSKPSQPDDSGRRAIATESASRAYRDMDRTVSVVIPGSAERHRLPANRGECPTEAGTINTAGPDGTRAAPGGEPVAAERSPPALSSFPIHGSSRSSRADGTMHPRQPESTAGSAVKETASASRTRHLPPADAGDTGGEEAGTLSIPSAAAQRVGDPGAEVVQTPPVDVQSRPKMPRAIPDHPGMKLQLPADAASRQITELERTVSALAAQVSALEARTRGQSNVPPPVPTPQVSTPPKSPAPAPAAFWERNYTSRGYRWSRR